MDNEAEFIERVLDGVTIADLGERCCKWPIGDPRSDDFRWCGRPTPAGRSYCSKHARLAYTAPRPSRSLAGPALGPDMTEGRSPDACQ